MFFLLLRYKLVFSNLFSSVSFSEVGSKQLYVEPLEHKAVCNWRFANNYQPTWRFWYEWWWFLLYYFQPWKKISVRIKRNISHFSYHIQPLTIHFLWWHPRCGCHYAALCWWLPKLPLNLHHNANVFLM